MAQEKIRGCGFRKVGGLYLVGSGLAYPCDNLPLELKPCECCGYTLPFTRGWVWVNKSFLKEHRTLLSMSEAKELRYLKSLGALEAERIFGKTESRLCKCPPSCPVCHPRQNIKERFMLMWVGRQYTPKSFIKEAHEMGVSKRIAFVPKELKLGETWVMLAYKKYPFQNDIPNSNLKSEPVYKPAIFYAFRPTRVEKLIWQSGATEEKLKEMEEQGLTPVIIKDGDKDHA